MHHAKAVTTEGRHKPTDVVPRDLLLSDAGACWGTTDYARGLAFAWGRYVGCSDDADRALHAALGDHADALAHPVVVAERALGCDLVRGR